MKPSIATPDRTQYRGSEETGIPKLRRTGEENNRDEAGSALTMDRRAAATFAQRMGIMSRAEANESCNGSKLLFGLGKRGLKVGERQKISASTGTRLTVVGMKTSRQFCDGTFHLDSKLAEVT